ncbi:hypothetical protein [Luteolibacter sp. Populi]|uniref:hypothetical protein n=1 Tax=Luteolibacter sp. Populi TaxID=3230487 RepID=UPI003466A9F1
MNRTYFLQWSFDLRDWHFFPEIEHGAAPAPYGINSTAETFFIRLKYTDIITSDPEGADFDADGLSNIDEVSIHDTDPLEWDTDGDGLDDVWEIDNGLDPRDDGSIDPANGGTGDPDSDGLSNHFEWWTDADPHNPDTDGDGLEDGEEFHFHHTSPTASDSDQDDLSDHDEVRIHGTKPDLWDTDEDTLGDGEEVLTHFTDPLDTDTDGDWMWDDWELANSLDPVDAADGLLDADGDGLANKLEFVFLDKGYNPLTPDAAGFPWTGDPDHDGKTTAVEFGTVHTNPRQPDTDGDAMNDGWEADNGFDPTVDNATDGDPTNDAGADPDGDGLSNEQESARGTKPNDPDSDGDGVPDGDEDEQGTNPNDPNDHQPPPQGTVAVSVTFGDHSESHSEMYMVYLEAIAGDTQNRQRTNRRYGALQTDTFHLPKGAEYKVTFKYIGTDGKYRRTPRPDYDYTLAFTSDEMDPAVKIVFDDPEGILGEHEEGDPFFAAGKTATLFTAHLISQTVATKPDNRERSKVGVGEVVDLTLKPSNVPSPVWALSGAVGTSTLDPLAGPISTLTAGERECRPVVEVTIGGSTLKINFEVIQPTGVTMTREPGTGIFHVYGNAITGFKGRAYVTPNDVSFKYIQVREGTCPAICEGSLEGYEYDHPVPRDDDGNAIWGDIVEGTSAMPSKLADVDQIRSGIYPPPFPGPDDGTFLWNIPWYYRLPGGLIRILQRYLKKKNSKHPAN